MPDFRHSESKTRVKALKAQPGDGPSIRSKHPCL